ncbi:MAG: LuxR family transcriptional regulator [Kordiimonas sp.]|nr:LuxR family transcriptional regulator [Kordiimonas sp.]|tara:strand:- start:8890 stop:9672 length:783 start_codon:yes stop_codon:yes gene_type:complete
MFVDSHCHLNYGKIADDLDGVLARAKDAGVDTMLAINARLSEFDDVLRIAKAHDNIFCSVGSHPHEAEAEPGITAEQLITMAEDKNVVGIGESGLDYYYDHAPRDLQKANFLAHIAASRETGLPLIVHNRESDDDCAELMAAEMGKGRYPALIHCFTATREFANKALDIGCYISLSGIVTFNSAKDLQAIARDLPLDRLLIETDAPYLAPVPMRGKSNEPAYVRHTAEFLAELLNMPLDDLAARTTDNFYELFQRATRNN